LKSDVLLTYNSAAGEVNFLELVSNIVRLFTRIPVYWQEVSAATGFYPTRLRNLCIFKAHLFLTEGLSAAADAHAAAHDSPEEDKNDEASDHWFEEHKLFIVLT